MHIHSRGILNAMSRDDASITFTGLQCAAAHILGEFFSVSI